MKSLEDLKREHEKAIAELSRPETVEVWELYRRRPVKSGNQASAYFDKVTFRQRFN